MYDFSRELAAAWIPVRHTDALAAYTRSLRHPLEVTEFPRRLGALADAFVQLVPAPEQLSLLGPAYAITELLHGVHKQGQQRPIFYTHITEEVKPSGVKRREVVAARHALEVLVHEYLRPIVLSVSRHPRAIGGERRQSAKRYFNSIVPIDYVLQFDVKDAFPSTLYPNVFDFYYDVAGSVASGEARRDFAGFAAHCSTIPYATRGGLHGLAQGTALSTELFNRVFPFDAALSQVAANHGVHYMRWVDDIVVSGRGTSTASAFAVLVAAARHVPLASQKVFLQQEQRLYVLGLEIAGVHVKSLRKSETHMARDGFRPVDERLYREK